MNQVRFSTVHDLFEAYPLARYDVGKAAPDKLSLDFLQEAADAGSWHQAVSFCAYLLPRRVAVAWGCRSLRRMFDQFDANDSRSLNFVETWVRQPDEQSRNKALAVGNANDPEQPATWLALAAGWSGGSVVPAEFAPVEAKPDQAARAVRAALLIALCRLPRESRDRIMTACLEDGIQLARGEPRPPR
ncbi:hypothetical protein RX327_24115 [Bradyrhizobium sp. BEA-2-5]|uniref:DUF6931 family protein n=1 Tax=Bradyrhizobium sp. BEA-2-5 TaxID=3080015 RepID=UPI00293EF0B5|nr:hypothetical protein [Bradyrhizobium sp. BEA-2-5]WOH78991.1 hypothetical protein RX327_24115 [Bradyrhizobium sp. BEA-2-5]